MPVTERLRGWMDQKHEGVSGNLGVGLGEEVSQLEMRHR